LHFYPNIVGTVKTNSSTKDGKGQVNEEKPQKRKLTLEEKQDKLDWPRHCSYWLELSWFRLSLTFQ